MKEMLNDLKNILKVLEFKNEVFLCYIQCSINSLFSQVAPILTENQLLLASTEVVDIDMEQKLPLQLLRNLEMFKIVNMLPIENGYSQFGP